MNDDLDELLQPTVQDAAAARGPLPWRVQSQFWVAFFGGPLAVTGIAYANAGRLGMDPKKRRLILVAGVVAVLLTAAVFVWIISTADAKSENRMQRISGRIIAVLLYLVLSKLQKEADEAHQIFGREEYAPLWNWGTVAILGGAVLQILVYMMVKMLTT